MTTLNILDFGGQINSTKDTTVAMQKALLKAKEINDNVTIEFPKGEYHFYKDFVEKRVVHTSNTDSCKYPTKHIGILIEDQENLTIDANESMFIFHGDVMAVAVIRSKNIELRNFEWDFPCATTVEMTVTKSNTFSTEFHIPNGFNWSAKGRKITWFDKSPYNNQDYWNFSNQQKMWGVVTYFPKTKNSCRQLYVNGPLFAVRSVRKIDDNSVKVSYFKKAPKIHKNIGMTFELCQSNKRDTAGAFIWESSDVHIQNVQPHYLCGFGWLTQMSHNVTFKDCKFIPNNKTERKTSSFADLIHVSGASGKIIIDGCEFSDAHDDPINIHGTFTRVKTKINDNTLILEYVHRQQGGFPQYHIGDQVVFYARDTLEAKDNEPIYTVKNVVNPTEQGFNEKTMQVTFQEKLPDNITDKIGTENKFVCENVTYTPEVQVKNSKFYSIPTRGILCTTRKKVIIENNEFIGMTMASIFLSNDSNEWYESGPIRDMTIRNNKFYILKPAAQTEWSDKGAIFVYPVTKGNKLPEWTNPIHKNITIEGNEFYMEHDTVVKASSVENLIIRNNIIKRYEATNMDKEITAFHFNACKNVVIENNKLEDTVISKPEIKNMPENEAHT